MFDILTIVLPVFIVMAFGYIVVWGRVFQDHHVDGLMDFAQKFAIPCLLFRAISTLDLHQNFDIALLTSFYTGVVVCFIVGLLGARYIFGRPWEDSVAIAFCCYFSNTLLLGVPITERAYGPDSLVGNFTIIAIHAPFGYMLGITAMELAHAEGTPLRYLPAKVLKAMFSNALVIAIACGFIVNLTQITLPAVFTDAVDLVARAALPTALFALGGILYRYRPEGDMRTVLFVCAISLGLHPAVVWITGTSLNLSTDAFRSAVITASVAPGINAYVFANIYGVAKRVAATAVLLSTVMAVLSCALWLIVLH